MDYQQVDDYEKDPESDYLIDIIENNKDSIAYGLYSKMRRYLYHYNGVKLRYKFLSSTWFISAFIGVGYILSGKEKNLEIDQSLIVAGICVLDVVGIILIYYLDIIIYHKLIESIFIHIIDFENKYPKLEKTNVNISKLLIWGRTGPVIFDGLFYAVAVLIMLSVSSLAVYVFLEKIQSIFAVGFLILSLIISALFSFFMVLISKYSGLRHIFKKDEV